MKTTKLGRAVALVGALTLASLGLATGAGATGFEAPDSTQEATLTIHKHEGTGTGDLGEYTGQAPTGLGTPLAGVEFTIQQVGTDVGGTCMAPDLATPAGWEAISAATVDNVCDIGSPVTVTTQADGSISQTLAHGMYKVTETNPGPNLIKETSVPFLVTLPMPVQPNTWDYSVDAYPKNTLADEPTKPTKEAADPDKFTPGALIDWTIKANVPAAALAYTDVTITDTIPAGLEFTQVKSVKVGTTELVKGADYNDGATIKLTADGLAKLNALVVGTGNAADVEVVLETKVLDTIAGQVTNEVKMDLNAKPGEPGTGTTVWGKLEVSKVDKSNNSPLKDAVFSIYEGKCADNGALVADGLTTDMNGKISQVLYVGKTEADTKDYCLKETAAPSGYILDDVGRDVTLSGTTTDVVLTFENVKVDGPDLPLTGAQGTALITGVGLVLLAAGAGTVYVARRRQR
ncbi:SpaH/EbpB family LPXTG-anchored major pilin [Trueperella bialowiezensis]|uniref:Fimbrial subunit type 1 n=1 Tax=Trueperella bialowiezensis TaxID=312285 RepID=A0A3S4WFZ8_9ACTO|nr:SpaH/EbpB family LPXTG-anchored major pilin [Trueperella bialowiezensis]VEI13007.1 Fimbrial subunit type 1 precursor [Trueperella bialowiezensis]